ncbi:endonuclease/exonuclease/phosphatase family protein [Actinomyces sp. B33]|uniref:endonuclease/exonuclease/phosphatase family protein n=1 Tax=Actinomyces sp. B33 TaxID=2942131 RepID=UPI0023402187|nr:endonuclease/exonuclease/phosphatase family protein [Actinomyces sp. B33]MDC4233810.1 endonuclease/exonuclease/phosphatase family protein [Actinomyces sp. B33]
MMKHPLAAAACLPLACGLIAASPAPAHAAAPPTTDALTIATFNASLNRTAEGQLLADLAAPDNEQAANAAETIQRVSPDIILINEFDYDPQGRAVDLFRTNYLEVGHNGADPVVYPYAWAGPVNTGSLSGFDLNGDGKIALPDDGWGFGAFPGQYGFVVYSKYPIKTDEIRTFQNFLWKDMPGALLPTKEDGTSWYGDDALAAFPLSSKTHADLPIDVDGTTVHVLAAHPTPPSFDGPEQRNKKRNFDEIRLWADYIADRADYLYDDAGVVGGLPVDANFVILGDYNSDPLDGDSYPGAIDQLLTSPRVVDTLPVSKAGPIEARLQGGANAQHLTDPIYDTGDFGDDPRPGNLRIDYVLPNAGTQVNEARVFWPTREDPLFRLTGVHPFPTSDHRLVWARMRFPTAAAPADDPQTGGSQPIAPVPDQPEAPSPQPSPDTPADASQGRTPQTAHKGSRGKNPSALAATGSSALTALAGAALLAAGGALLPRTRRSRR